ncbi:hypothetical protein [Halorhodospira halophila]|uniref:Uncharacterized protein n=1 Tax=Halorhodospira halophila (strain DSM 244 / SL1) TaxID=349124 RepID=A1WVZ4_HALHL|nr:hypothetical protein [Halorhodospira halophila]ABM61856.1 conserved hypothetical protein [Halorhodospira halophila SL1]MBK1729842.1 hypothetical protein [Halorhodospira halophila]
MVELFDTGRIIDAILLLMVLEGALLYLVYRRSGWGLAPGTLVTTLAAGGFLLLALRAALTDAAWYWVSAWLLAGLAAHLADLWQRLRPQ